MLLRYQYQYYYYLPEESVADTEEQGGERVHGFLTTVKLNRGRNEWERKKRARFSIQALARPGHQLPGYFLRGRSLALAGLAHSPNNASQSRFPVCSPNCATLPSVLPSVLPLVPISQVHQPKGLQYTTGLPLRKHYCTVHSHPHRNTA